MNQTRNGSPGLEAFWETCDRDGVGDHPLVRELLYRLDAIQRYRGLIADAEESGNDEAVQVLSGYFDDQHQVVRRIREQLRRIEEVAS